MPTMHYFIDPCLTYFTAKNQIEISFPQLILKTKVIKFLKRMFLSGGFLARGVFVQGAFVRGFMSGGFCRGVFVLEPIYNTPRLLNPMSGYSPTSSTTISLSSQILQSSHWHSGMSPYSYELIEFLSGVISKCYGCNQEFANRYKVSPSNHIVRHRDRRIRGKEERGNIVYNDNFTCSYYHPNRRHIEMKNPIFNGDVFVSNTLYLKLGTAKVATLSAASGLRILKIQDPSTPLSSGSIGH